MSLGLSYAPYTGGTKAARRERPDADLRHDPRPAPVHQDHASARSSRRGSTASARPATCPTSSPSAASTRCARCRSTASIGNTAGVPEPRVPVPRHRLPHHADPRDPRHPRQGLPGRRRRRAEEPAVPVLVRLRRCAASAASASRAATARRAAWPTTGSGIELNFLGLPLHFDFARQWNFKGNLGPAQCCRDRPRDEPAATSRSSSTSGRPSRAARPIPYNPGPCPHEHRSPSARWGPTAAPRPAIGMTTFLDRRRDGPRRRLADRGAAARRRSAASAASC